MAKIEAPDEYKDRIAVAGEEKNGIYVVAVVGCLINLEKDFWQTEELPKELDPNKPLRWYARVFAAKLKSPSEIPLVFLKPKEPTPGKLLIDEVGYELAARTYPNDIDGKPFGLGTMPIGIRGKNHLSPPTGLKFSQLQPALVSVVERGGNRITLYMPRDLVLPICQTAIENSAQANMATYWGLPEELRPVHSKWAHEIMWTRDREHDNRFVIENYHQLVA